jgi:putative ABC transport system substrate-binding protein
MIPRRRLLAAQPTLIAGAILAAALPAHGQAPRTPRIGAIHWESAAATERMEDLRQPLRALGLEEGRTLALEWRWAERSAARVAEAVAEFERLGVDVLFVHTTPTVHAVRATGTQLPVVVFMSDPLATGIVSNLGRPGGNITGVGTLGPELAPKRLELLRELLPGLSRVAFLGATLDPNTGNFIRETEAAAAKLGITVIPVTVEGPQAFEAAFARMKAAEANAVIVQALFNEHRAAIVDLQLRHRIPAVGDQSLFARDGALVSYGADRRALFTRVAAKIDAILKGARPGDLPVELPTTFELVLNKRTAATLGIRIPDGVLLRADEIIE